MSSGTRSSDGSSRPMKARDDEAPMMLEVAVDADEEWDSSRLWHDLALKAARAAIAESDYPELADADRAVEISVTLTGDEQVRALNAQWRGKDRPTNVL